MISSRSVRRSGLTNRGQMGRGPAAAPAAGPSLSATRYLAQRVRNSFMVLTWAWSLVKTSSGSFHASSMVRSIE